MCVIVVCVHRYQARIQNCKPRGFRVRSSRFSDILFLPVQNWELCIDKHREENTDFVESCLEPVSTRPVVAHVGGSDLRHVDRHVARSQL